MTTRTITLNMDSVIGNKLYWFLREVMIHHSKDIKEVKKKDVPTS